MALLTNITRPLGMRVGEGADEGREHHVEEGEHRRQRGAPARLAPADVRSSSTAATSKALSASELKNCADMMVEKPFFIVSRAASGATVQGGACCVVVSVIAPAAACCSMAPSRRDGAIARGLRTA
jgi:hypothetical protein